MRSWPLLTIAINNYNYGRFVGEAIHSALAQTYPHVEVIVVDDGSTDDSRAVIESYGRRIRAIFKENGGQASALNAGFAAARGDLAMFLDSDDTLLPNAAAVVADAWRVGMARAYFPLEVIDAEGKSLGRLAGSAAVPNCLLGPFGVGSPTSGNAFSRAVLNRIMPVPEQEWRICADAYLTAAGDLFGETVRLPLPLGKHRVHTANHLEGARPGLASVRRAIHFDLRLHKALRHFGGERVPSLDRWLSAYPQHWLARLTSLRESRSDHPWPDSLPVLLWKSLGATWRQPFWNKRRKLTFTLFAIGCGTAPISVVRRLRGLETRVHRSSYRSLLGGVESGRANVTGVGRTPA